MLQEYDVGDLVWAKMKGYPPWPARISEPKLDAKSPKNKKAHFVYFFGSENFAWILDENIRPHSESFLHCLSKKKSVAYQNAIDSLLKCSKSNKEKQVTPRKENLVPEANKSPQRKVVKVINSVQKKSERKVMLSRPEKKIPRKRSQSLNQDVNGRGGKCKSLKKRKIDHCKHKYEDSCNSYLELASISTRNTSSDYDKFMMDFGIGKSGDSLERKHVLPSKKKIGFIGLGHMGKAIVINLLKSGHNVRVWNKTTHKSQELENKGAKIANSPSDLIIACDITFCCVSDAAASKSLIFEEKGILKGLEQSEKLGLRNKGYVEMTSLDPNTSAEIAEAVERKQGKYLEAPVCGTSKNAEDGTLLVLAAGDSQLFYDCETCFHAIGKKAYYIDCEAGAGAKMGIVLSALSGTICGALAEAMVLSKRLSLPEFDLLNIFCQGPLRMDNLVEKTTKMLTRNFQTITPLKHIQKDLQFCLLMGDRVSQHTPIFAAVNEVFKRAKLLNYSNLDVSAVFQGVRY